MFRLGIPLRCRPAATANRQRRRSSSQVEPFRPRCRGEVEPGLRPTTRAIVQTGRVRASSGPRRSIASAERGLCRHGSPGAPVRADTGGTTRCRTWRRRWPPELRRSPLRYRLLRFGLVRLHGNCGQMQRAVQLGPDPIRPPHPSPGRERGEGGHSPGNACNT